jgi:hypothetical protein
LINNGVEVFSVKTDAFTIRQCEVEKAKSLINFDNKIGNWRVSKTDDYKLPSHDFKILMNKEIQIVEPTAERIEIKNEWDTKEICSVFEDKKRVMVRAEYAGCGKSYAASYMEKFGHKVLFVCPQNKLAFNSGGITAHKFFGYGASDDVNVAKFDATDYDVIVFDEIYMSAMKVLRGIKRYCENNPDKIVIGTGDMNQLQSVESPGNNVDDDYKDTCINMIFPFEVYLVENKRLKTEEDKLKNKQLKKDIFNEDISIEEVIEKYGFEKTDKLTTTQNIAYQNNTCISVAKQVRVNLNKTEDYEVGEKLICRKYFKMKGITFNTNYEYEIIKCSNDSIEIRDNQNKGEYNIPKHLIQKNFFFDYCATCHSLQGSTINQPITIHEWNFKHVNRKWLYTAITRATYLKNVRFFIGGCVSKNDDDAIGRYFSQKVNGYIKQDNTANRKIQNDYVTVKWLEQCIGINCAMCSTCLHCEVDDKNNIDCNITAQRVDNSRCHSIDNIIPYCVYCNVSQSNR